jgi:TRAP-type uncharacterized transport system fused permease subunit
MCEPREDGAAPTFNGRIDTTHIAMGLRRPQGQLATWLVLIGLTWSAFQLWIASPLPEMLGLFMNEARIRSLHLGLAVLLAFLAYPASSRASEDRFPLLDLVLAVLAALSACYLALFYTSVSSHAGAETVFEIGSAGLGMLLLLEATRRVLGLPMVGLALVLLAYVFLGEYMPDPIAHKSASFGKAMSHLWLSTEGVFGVALGVSAGLIFLFVLFGALLETAGAGSYFIRCAVALLGHLRGGPAKAAVVASAVTGMISGSSITNVVTTGPLTIPLIKHVCYPAQKAAAIEVAASVNGQVMPPVMGAAAFLMVEYVGVSYIEVLKHALISAMVSYLGLLYIVHLEAVKGGYARPAAAPHSPLATVHQHFFDRFRRHCLGADAGVDLDCGDAPARATAVVCRHGRSLAARLRAAAARQRPPLRRRGLGRRANHPHARDRADPAFWHVFRASGWLLDLEPGDRTTLADPCGFLGHRVPGLHCAHPAPTARLVSWRVE